jgi:hypothetical protein
MSYAQGGTIAATDYNGLASTTIGGNIAYVWGTGSGQWGYGQSTSLISSVATEGTVTAVQWAGLIYTLNNVLAHQSGTAAQLATGSNIGTVAGATITYFSNVATACTTINTNKALFNSVRGTTITGATFTYTFTVASSAAATTGVFTRTVTFPSGNAARYFFNAGGRLQFVISGVTNGAATARGTDWVTLLGTNLGGSTIDATASAGRTGAGGTQNTNSTTSGYYNLTTTTTEIGKVTSAGATYTYTVDYANVVVKTNGVQGSNSDNGTVITFTCYQFQPAQTNSNFNDTVSAVISHRIDILPPETTYMANVWGAIGIT